ncbi:helix-turn-helix transcriptional regulator [Dactylosporangium vinaceum]|uniref:TetR/AcrR family transcriptional regulator n=1 Tax=Dactylosporangium vinaceum TaxID=53362 RepID=A0ABV5MDC3_9ACTN|nr:TetR family transcriptional regulator [Dactylosporangium vinaceum]UAC00723.1 helix-turn-helix transcriptional regulator [Dactylosporangium vinaceum]
MPPLTDPGPLRADSARVRAQMLTAARARIRDGDLDLPMNAIAKAAGVGVGTAYRHFPTRQALLEALAAESLAALVTDAVAGAADPDPAAAFTALLRSGLQLLRDDPTLAAVLSSTEPPCLATTTALNAQLGAAVQTTLTRARAEHVIRPDVTADDIRRLICGLQHAVAAGQDDAAERYLDILLAGLRP